MNRPLSRRQKYRVHHASIEQLEARYQCKTCPEVIEHDAAIYCMRCRTYWEDVANGLFDNEDDFSCGAESNRHSGAVGAEKRAEQSNPGGGHEVTEHDAQKPYERKAAGMIPRPAADSFDDQRCDCGHLFEICDSPNCPLGYPDPAERWEGWPDPQRSPSVSRPQGETR